ncbi:hypothetical protein B0H13DRAFT_1870743 [Mycena leptocephala]|nr:hypothetical protein B0H13DRAFT_1870743 [Mycena leptocephala]
MHKAYHPIPLVLYISSWTPYDRHHSGSKRKLGLPTTNLGAGTIDYSFTVANKRNCRVAILSAFPFRPSNPALCKVKPSVIPRRVQHPIVPGVGVHYFAKRTNVDIPFRRSPSSQWLVSRAPALRGGDPWRTSRTYHPRQRAGMQHFPRWLLGISHTLLLASAEPKSSRSQARCASRVLWMDSIFTVWPHCIPASDFNTKGAEGRPSHSYTGERFRFTMGNVFQVLMPVVERCKFPRRVTCQRHLLLGMGRDKTVAPMRFMNAFSDPVITAIIEKRRLAEKAAEKKDVEAETLLDELLGSTSGPQGRDVGPLPPIIRKISHEV